MGREGLLEISKREDIDLMLNGLVGASGMAPTLNSVGQGVDVALSNKESLVMAGDLITRTCQEKKAKIFPIDSEHSAIWHSVSQCIKHDVKRLIFTSSMAVYGHGRRSRAFDEKQTPCPIGILMV